MTACILGPEHRELIFEYATWVIQACKEDGLQVSERNFSLIVVATRNFFRKITNFLFSLVAASPECRMIGEVLRWLSLQTTVYHEAELEGELLWHIQPVQFVMQELSLIHI